MAERWVKVAVLGGKVQEVLLKDDGDKTVADALELAEIEDTEGYEIKINKRKGTLDDEVLDRDIVVLVPKIEGGSF